MAEAGTDADLVAVDFYSRYQRPTAPSCERFAAAPGAPACKTNRLRWCHTDLGANVVSYQRFLAEGRRFGGLGVSAGGSWELGAAKAPACQGVVLGKGGHQVAALLLSQAKHGLTHAPLDWPAWLQGVSGGLGAEHFDGIMMQLLMAASWRVKHLEGYCPFNHAPSFQVRRGGLPAEMSQEDVLMCVCYVAPSPGLPWPASSQPPLLHCSALRPRPCLPPRAVLRLDWRCVG